MLSVVKSAEDVNLANILKLIEVTLLRFHAITFALALERSLISIYT